MSCIFNGREFRVVIPVVAGVGNALMAEPMVRLLKRHCLGARITIIARIDAMAEVFRRMPEVEETLVTGKRFKGLWRQFWWTLRRRADVYLVPFPSNRWQYNLAALLSGARRRVKHRFPIGKVRALGWLPATRVDAVRGIHDVEQNLRLLEALGVAASAEAPRFNVLEEDRRRARELLADAGIGEGDHFVALHPGSGATPLGRAKRWPVDKYAQLIELLRREIETRVVVMEGPDETGVADEIIRAYSSRSERAALAALRLRGPLGDAAAILARASLYIGSDSGLAHLAAAVGTKAVTIFAPADPERVSPYGNRDLVVRPAKSCSPCFQYPWNTPYPKILCREPYCVAEVPLDGVMDAVRHATNASRRLNPSPSARGTG